MGGENSVFARSADTCQTLYDGIKFWRRYRQLGMRPFHELSIEEAREQFLRLCLAMTDQVNFTGQETEMVVPSPHDPKGLPITVYKPQNCAETPAIWIYFHGGGFVMGSPKYVESALKAVAMEAGAIVINAGYRLLPLAHAPCAPFDDGDTVTRWVLANKATVGGKEGSAVGVGGDSAGALLAASIINEITGLDFQILLYPMTDTVAFETASSSSPFAKWIFENTLKNIPNFKTDPRFNPAVRTNTETTPPTLILMPGLDPLVPLAQSYAEKLRAAGVSVQFEVTKGVPHGFFTYNAVYQKKAAAAYVRTATFIKEIQGHQLK